jgi:hypothetical protein
VGVGHALDAAVGDGVTMTHGAVGVAIAVLDAGVVDTLVPGIAVPVGLTFRAGPVVAHFRQAGKAGGAVAVGAAAGNAVPFVAYLADLAVIIDGALGLGHAGVVQTLLVLLAIHIGLALHRSAQPDDTGLVGRAVGVGLAIRGPVLWRASRN